MDRLTARDSSGHTYYPKCFEHPCVGERSCCTYTAKMDCKFEGKVAERLAEYEDTGLDPDEITLLKNYVELLERDRQWIPVSEMLPDEPFACDVTILDSNSAMMEEFENVLPYHVGYDGENWNDVDGNAIPFEVIAWMKAPESYREE